MVIHTHLHNDHCENDYKCENAEIYVHEKEIERIHNPHPLDYRYLEDYIEDVEENGQIRMITGDREILPGIRVVHTPVHTEGGLTVFIDTPSGQAAITGFCVIKENFYPPIQIKAMEMEVIPPGTVVNAYEAYDIMLNYAERQKYGGYTAAASRTGICISGYDSLMFNPLLKFETLILGYVLKCLKYGGYFNPVFRRYHQNRNL